MCLSNKIPNDYCQKYAIEVDDGPNEIRDNLQSPYKMIEFYLIPLDMRHGLLEFLILLFAKSPF